ncbi:UNVERIFIED_CONTAM: hypothetical protein RMT77_011050 [Armadillidium vulgare]
MNRSGRLKDLAWGEFESVNGLENGKTVKKRKCNHCSNLVSNKIERIRAHLGKCDQYKLIGQGEGCSDDGDVEMAAGFSPAPAVPVGQSRSTTPYRSRSRSPVPGEPRSVSPATSIRTPTPTPSPSRPSAASMMGTIVTKQETIL